MYAAITTHTNTQLLDYDSARAKMKKLVEKPSDDASRLPRVS